MLHLNKKYYSILFLLLLSCTFSTSRLNDKKDQDQAVKVCTSFYHYLQAKQYNKTHPILADTFLKVIDTASLKLFYEDNDDKFGKISSIELISCKTNSKGGSKQSLTAEVTYLVKRAVKATHERLILTAANADSLKIIRYDVGEVKTANAN